MNTESLPENGQNAAQMNSIGPRLRQARENLHLTITDVARQLRLTNERIHLLETNNYQEMPGITYVKGYLRGYARLVNLPADEIIAEFDRLNLMPETKTFSLSSHKPPFSLGEKSIRRLIYVIGIGLFILVAVWWNSAMNSDSANLTNAKRQPLQNNPLVEPANTVPPTGALNLAKNPASMVTQPQAVNNKVQEATPNPNPATNSSATNISVQQTDKLATPSSSSSDATTKASAETQSKPTGDNRVPVEEDVNEAPVKSHNQSIAHPRPRISESFDDDDE